VRLLIETVRRFLDNHLLDWAAALTFYAGISLIPALVIVIASLGLIGDPALDELTQNLNSRDDGPVREIALDAIDEVSTNKASAGVALLVGIVGALWSASSYVGGFLRGSGVIHGRTVRYPIWKLRPLQLVLTAATIVAISGTALVVVITGPLAKELAALVGLEEVVAETWDLAKWPLVIGFVLSIFAVLYWASPDVRDRGFQLITPGGVIATCAWVIGSVAYAVYVEAFADYNALYGSLGAVVGFLIWLWLSNMAMLYGVELNAWLERQHDRAGTPERIEIAS
jgi:YihY family inner membrane protein